MAANLILQSSLTMDSTSRGKQQMLLTKLGTGKVSASLHCRLQVAVKTAMGSYGPHCEKQHEL